MTGLELLKQEMIKRGCTKQMTESKTAAVLMDIFANNGTDDYLREYEIREKLSKYDMAERLRENRLLARESEVKRKEADLERIEKAAVEADDKIKAFMDKLMECETPEGRDAMRTAQFFMNVANCETSQNRTAFINGLAAILSRTPLSIPFEPIKIDQPVKNEGVWRTPKAGHR